MAAVFPEVLNLFFLSIGTYGMFQGTDINHPIYALLFSNLIFPLICTILNFVILILKSFDQWMRASMMINNLSTLFHLVSWSVTSILRFLYLEHHNWLDSKFTDVKKLKILSLFAQFGFYLFLLILNLVCLSINAVPYGWPKKTFLHHVPFNLQIRVSAFFACVYVLPVLVSVTFYVILLTRRSKLFHNSVDLLMTEPVLSTLNHKEICCITQASGVPNYDSRGENCLYDLGANSSETTPDQSEQQNVEQKSINEILGPKIEHDILSVNSVSQSNFENEQNKKRLEAEKESAMRALRTNLFLNVLSISGLSVWLIPSDSLRYHLIVFLMSVLKGFLPIATTMENFGTIRAVSMKFIRIIF